MTLAAESARILEENQRLSETVARLEAQVANLAGLLQKVGFEAAREYSHKLLSKACEDFRETEAAQSKVERSNEAVDVAEALRKLTRVRRQKISARTM